MKAPGSHEKPIRLVLAVDDDEDHLLAYEVAFGRERGLRLITATNTRAAGIALRAHGVDAMLLDLSIPEDGGIALCRRIKAHRGSMTCRSSPVTAERAFFSAFVE